MTPDEILQQAKDKLKLAQEREQTTRDEGLEDLKFARLGEQWPDVIRKARELEHRPILTENRLRPFIFQVVNEVRQNKPGIIVHPADDGADKETAEIYNGLIRNIQVTSDADVATDTAAESAASNGFGYFRINITEDGQALAFERVVNPFRIFGDPDSECADSSDWNCAHDITMLDKDEFDAAYPEAQKSDFDLDFRGIGAPWREGDQVMVCSYWHREGETVTQYIMTAAEILETRPWPGKFIPIVPVYGEEINIEGKRYFRSLINQAKDSQRRFNYWLTAATELVALAPRVPYIGEEGVFDADPNWDTAHSQNHAKLEYTRGMQRPERQPFDGVPTGMVQAMMSASEGIKAVLGTYDASLGNRSNETSGVAIRARQMEGDVATFHFIDNVSRAIRHAGRILIDLIPRVYSVDRMLRILGEDMKPQTVRVSPDAQNEMQMQQQQAAMQAQSEEDLMARLQKIERVYDLSAGRYDLIVKAGPSYTSLREETRQELVELIRGVPGSGPILMPMYLKNSDWVGAEEAAEKFESGGMPPEAMEEISNLKQQIAENDIKAQEIALKNRELDLKAQELMVKDAEAQADIIRAQTEAAYGPLSQFAA
jgi:hypothetical protein